MSEVFKRYEKKYVLNSNQYQYIKEALKDKVVEDEYSNERVMSIYYDTDNYELIRRSLEKPEFKEKLRIRTYGPTKLDDKIFVEIKKKLDGVVYKRRTKSTYIDALRDIYDCELSDKQVGREINYFLNFYKDLKPVFYIAANRLSYKGKSSNLRITFDIDLTYRTNNLSLKDDTSNKKISDDIIMEIKVNEAMPLWLTHILDDAKAYPSGYSKVGQAYLKEMKERIYS